MTRYLLDTDICIHVLRRKSPVLQARLPTMADRLFVSVITLAELTFGGLKSRHPERAEREIATFASNLVVVPLTRDIVADYAEIRLKLERTGSLIGPNDLLIAAQARAAGLVMVTGNRREFDRVPGLTVESWLA